MGSLFSRVLDNTNPRSLASRFRMRRSIYVRREVDQAIRDTGHCSVVDLGGTASYWNGLDWFATVRDRIDITLVNTDTIGDTQTPPFRCVHADAADPALLQDRVFDVCHSNSVIEHVGNWNRKKVFASNVMRLGRSHVVQTPNYCFPIEPHFFCPLIHWLPKPMKLFLLTRYALGWSRRPNTLEEAIERLESIDLLTLKEMQALFPASQIRKERVAGMVKSFIAVKSAAPAATQ